MPEQHRITATVESPLDGVAGTVSVPSAMALEPCQQTRSVIGLARPRPRQLIALAKPQRRTLSVEIPVEKYHQARLRRPTACATAADNNVAEHSLVRVRHTIQVDRTTADIEERDISYYAEFDAARIEAEVDLYWNSVAKRYWSVEATQYEVKQPTPVLERRLQSLESLLERYRKKSVSYLIEYKIDDVEVVTTRASKLISRDSHTYDGFMAQIRPFGNSLHRFLQDRLNGTATKIALTIHIEELVK